MEGNGLDYPTNEFNPNKIPVPKAYKSAEILSGQKLSTIMSIPPSDPAYGFIESHLNNKLNLAYHQAPDSKPSGKGKTYCRGSTKIRT
jgi:hypothetical protein